MIKVCISYLFIFCYSVQYACCETYLHYLWSNFSQGNPCNENRGPCNENRGSLLNENRFIPCVENFTWKTLFWPCTGPVQDCSDMSSINITTLWRILLFVDGTRAGNPHLKTQTHFAGIYYQNREPKKGPRENIPFLIKSSKIESIEDLNFRLCTYT